MSVNTKDEESSFPYEIVDVDPKINSELLHYFTGERTGYVQVGPQKWLLPSGYRKEALNYYNFQVRPDDVWVVTFPRSGTTLTQEMVWLLGNDHDYDTAVKKSLKERFPFFDFSMVLHSEVQHEINEMNNGHSCFLEDQVPPAWKILENQTGKRFIKTHLPFSLLPPKLLTTGCKVIYVARNPKDTCLSFYHLDRLARTQGYRGDFPRYWNYFEKNLRIWTPYWTHIQEGWERRHSENMLFLFYEDIVKDLKGSIEKVANFLGETPTKDQINKLENHLKIENFRKNPSVNNEDLIETGYLFKNKEPFIRKGKTGGWQEEFTPELSKRADEWIEESLKRTDLRFPSN